jgi:hypothetical protein
MSTLEAEVAKLHETHEALDRLVSHVAQRARREIFG